MIYYLIKDKEYRKNYLGKRGIKIVVLCAFIIFILILPIVISNYLLYKDKGIVDFQISRFLNINKEFYQGIGGIESPFMISQLGTGLDAGFHAFWNWDAIISILAILGFIITFRKYKEANLFLFLWFIFVFLFIAGTAWLDTHFVFNTLIFSIFAALFLIEINELVIRKLNFKKFLVIALIIIFLFNVYFLWNYLTSETAVEKMRTFAIKNINENELVIVDQRIFRGRTALMFNDKAYVESENINQILKSMEAIQENPIPIKTFFIECIPDDCGWGTIKNQPELNSSVESMIGFFKNISTSEKIIYGGGGYDEDKSPYFKIYETSLNLKPSILLAVKQIHYHFFYPVGWEGDIYDKYQVYDDLDNLLNKFGFFVFYMIIILEVISPLILIWFFRKNISFNGNKKEQNEVFQKLPPSQS